MNQLKIILDTNILISGLLLSSSTSEKLFDIVTKKHILLISESTFTEFYKTITKKKFDKYISLEKRLKFLDKLREKAIIIDIHENITLYRDIKDNQFLELAVSSKADFIIPKYNDLLVLHPFRYIEIIIINEFLSRFN